MEFKHTPGPWTWQFMHNQGEDKWVLIGGDRYVYGILECLVEGSPQGLNDPANARLIAAAPELLEALEKLVAWVCNDDYTAEARAVIAKATGDDS